LLDIEGGNPALGLQVGGVQAGWWSNCNGAYGGISLTGTLISNCTSGYNFLSSTNSNYQNLLINRPPGFDIQFQENAVTQMTLKGGGYVGIGTTTPAGTLDVEGGTAKSGNGVNITIQAQNGATGGPVTYGGNILLLPGGGFDANGVAGYVGIGTATPTAPLTVFSGFQSSAAPGLSIVNQSDYSSGTLGIKGSLNSGTWTLSAEGFNLSDANNLNYNFNGSTKASFASNGNVGIGTNAPGYRLDVQGGKVNSAGGYCINGSNCITAWPSGGGNNGTVTSVATGAGLTGGPITTTGTVSLNLGSANTWTGAQAFSANTGFPGGIWNTSGNVGIGTTTPAAALDVNGAIDIKGNNGLWQDLPNADVAVGPTALPTTISQAGGGLSGQRDTAVGWHALNSNTTGAYNTAVGYEALVSNTTGGENTAFGEASLDANTTGANNTAVGVFSQAQSVSGSANTALGQYSLTFNQSGSNNTALGYYTGASIVAGSGNILIGNGADLPSGADASNTLNIGNAIFGTGLGGTLQIGIGTASPQHTLHVAGTIGAQEVIVSANGADYVFQPDYHLSPLTEVATYIEQNHHLPGIPSAKEVQVEGVNLGDMQTKLLAKIEELTLHMIQLDERNARLEQQNQELQKRIAQIEQR
jgi:hypothetical protein